MTLAIAFFGVTRSLYYTNASIHRSFLDDLRRDCDAQVFCHFYQQSRIENPRSGEYSEFDPAEYKLLAPDHLELESPFACLGASGFTAFQAYGDFWDDGFLSLRNLVHQLHSIRRVTAMVLEKGNTSCLFVRPDLEYLDPLARTVHTAIARPRDRVLLPAWQNWGGFNDRFALCVGRKAIAAWGNRLDTALEYCLVNETPLHSEGLVRYVMDKAHLPVELIPHRAGRVRAHGGKVSEDFAVERAKILKLLARRRAKLLLTRLRWGKR